MGRVKRLDDCKKQRDFLKWAQRQGAEVRNGGPHVNVTYDGYSVPIPNGEIRPGTKRSIIKSFLKIGLALLFWALAFAGGGYVALLLGVM